MAERYYLTTPIYYVNDRPHIGHAYTTILADVVARRRRTTGYDVRFLTGTDEHGASVALAAARRGIDPRTHVDELAPSWKATWDRLEIRYDRFIRTTDADHAAVVRHALTALQGGVDPDGRSLLYEDLYRGWYCVSDERYWTEKDLADGRCPECGKPVEEIEERNWFFRMSSFQEALVEHIRRNPGFIHPETRANEILGFLREPLGDLCITRPRERLSWGIPIPWDDGFVTYVWVDALLNYVTGAVDVTGDPEADARRAIAAWNEHPADVHLIGKDILTTHSVYWITLLMALGWSLPRQILAHGWWIWQGTKMSKSTGNVVRPEDLVPEFGVDGLRYYLLREMTLGQDSSFSYESIVRRLNADLANDLGNLHSRITKMAERWLDARLPARPQAAGRANEAALRELAERLVADGAEGSVSEAWGQWRIHTALERVLGLVSATNEYLEAQAPWAVAREKPESGDEVGAILLHAAEALRLATVLLWPVAPDLAQRLLADLGQPEVPRGEHLRWGVLDGTRLTPGPPIYRRIEPAEAT